MDLSRAGSRTCSVAATLLIATVLAWLFVASPAWGHAALVGTDPVDGAAFAVSPQTVTLTFNEPVEVPTGALRVFDASAELVETPPFDTGVAEQVAVALPDALPDGGYVVTYRVISTDAHPISGVFSFTVGGSGDVDEATLGQITADSSDGPAARVGTALRGIGYLTALLAGGAGWFAVGVARRASDRGVVRRIARRAAWLAFGVTLLSVPVQAATLIGDVGAMWSPSVLGEVVGSSFGVSALVRLAALLSMIVLWRPGIPLTVPAVAGLVAATSYTLDGHQRSVEPTWLLMVGDTVHLGAAAVWFAGLVLLTFLMRGREPDDDPIEAAGLVTRFSSLALVAFGVVSLGGIAMAIPLVGSVPAATSTAYGWTLLAKVALVGLVVLLAVHNRLRLVPAIRARTVPAKGSVDAPTTDGADTASHVGAAWSTLRRTVRIEAALLAAVLLVTGALVTIPPASQTPGAGGIYETTVPLGETRQLDLVVDPNQVGVNTMHLYVLDPTGRPSGDVEDVTLELTFVPEGVGPIVIEPYAAGPGHWIATIEELTFAGAWEVRVVAGIDRFTEETAVVTVPVAP